MCLSTVQFAGSLGKLTVSSVNNPRKMIDAVVTARTDDEVSQCVVLIGSFWMPNKTGFFVISQC